MSSGYGANYGDVITEEQIKKVVEPKTWKNFTEWVEKEHEGIDSFGIECKHQEYDVDSLENKDPYVDLVKEFEEKTKLNLELSYHFCDDEGSCYDEVDGAFWITYNAYEKTPEAKAFEEKYGSIERKFWVTYG